MKKLTKDKLKQATSTQTKKEDAKKQEGQAQCCAKVSKIVAGCHD